MWHVNLGLVLAWFIPILLGVLLAIVLRRFSEHEPGSNPARAERHDDGSNRLHGDIEPA